MALKKWERKWPWMRHIYHLISFKLVQIFIPDEHPIPSWSNMFSKFRIFGNLSCYGMVSGWYLIRTEFHWVAIWKVSLGTVFRFWNFVWTPKIQKREDFHFKGNMVCLLRFLLPMLKAHLYRGVHPCAVQPVKGVKGCGEGEKSQMQPLENTQFLTYKGGPACPCGHEKEIQRRTNLSMWPCKGNKK